jgi:hypothetical protein
MGKRVLRVTGIWVCGGGGGLFQVNILKTVSARVRIVTGGQTSLCREARSQYSEARLLPRHGESQVQSSRRKAGCRGL